MTKPNGRIVYNVRILPPTVENLHSLAGDLGLFVTIPGAYFGSPSVGQLLERLALLYRENPGALVDALRSAGVVTTAESLGGFGSS